MDMDSLEDDSKTPVSKIGQESQKKIREQRAFHLAEARRLAAEMGAYEVDPDPSLSSRSVD